MLRTCLQLTGFDDSTSNIVTCRKALLNLQSYQFYDELTKNDSWSFSPIWAAHTIFTSYKALSYYVNICYRLVSARTIRKPIVCIDKYYEIAL